MEGVRKILRIVVTIGWKRVAKEGQKINVWHNEEEVNWDTHTGKFLTPMSDRNFRCFYLAEVEADPGDRIHIRCQTGLRGKGQDEIRTFDYLFVVGSETDQVEEKVMSGVGFHRYPLIKGRVRELSNVSAEDLRLMQADDFIKDGF